MLAPVVVSFANHLPSAVAVAATTKNYQFVGYSIGWVAYGVLVAQAWLNCGRSSQTRQWLKWSIVSLVVLNTIKVVCELWRICLIFGVHLAEAAIYAVYWRRHLQDPVILIAGAIIVGLSDFVLAKLCGAVLCENKDAKRPKARLALLYLLYGLALLSLLTGVSLNAYLHSFESYLSLLKSYRQRIPVTLVLANLWAALNLLMSLLTVGILSVDLWETHRQLTALDEIFDRRSKNPAWAFAQRLFFVSLRNGCYMIPLHIAVLASNGIRAWTGILISIAPQGYTIAVLAYTSAPRRPDRVAALPSISSGREPWDPNAPPEPSSFASSLGSCTCLCCSHEKTTGSGPEVWVRMLERWRSSVRRIRIGEKDMNRAIERVGRATVTSVDKPSSESAGKIDPSAREVGVVGGRLRGVDEEESWIEKSDRMLSPKHPTLHPTLPPQPLRVAFTQTSSTPANGAPRPRTFRRATSIEDELAFNDKAPL